MAKTVLLLIPLCCSLSVIMGCQNADKGVDLNNNRGVDVLIEGDGQFPKVMVGVWEAKVSRWSKWGLKFERDGSILRIVHSLAGPVVLSEGDVYLEGPDPNTHAIFVMGDCDADYLPETNELKVKVILDYYRMQLPTGVLEGRIESYFSGPVSKDGQTWAADLRQYPRLEGAATPDPNIINENPEKLVFTKLDVK